MSLASIAARPFDASTLERRSRQRFPLALELEYRLLGRDERYGSGQTCNISSTGVLFEVAEWQSQQPFSGSIEVMLSWPCLLNGVRVLKLMMKGRVVRSEGRGVAIESIQHEFRTAGLYAIGRRRT
jgi:hypothetical protein